MKILVVAATPSISSFNFAIAERVVSCLTEQGHTVWFHDLYREKFPAILENEEIASDAELDPLITSHCEELTSADGVVIIHPNWWGQPPAILKGWVDRIIRPGTAYVCEGNPGEVGEVIGLLTGKFGVVFTTGDTDTEREMSYFLDPLETLWKNCIFGFCGVEKFTRRHFNIVLTSTLEQRKAWLDEVKTVLQSYLK
ncbi:MAG: NAD(P)H-dependent oxidoreductase [Pirellulales bacterium]|nr:NAD(P)H-dependent oxidoreductase [Pirellulales bacterium]